MNAAPERFNLQTSSDDWIGLADLTPIIGNFYTTIVEMKLSQMS